MTRRSLAALLERVFPLPVPADAGERTFFADLPWRSLDELRLERQQIRLRLLLDPAPRTHWWLLRRLELIDRELQR